jgi:hypothetical protein
MALLLKHQTQKQFIDRVREIYRDGDNARVIAVSRWAIAAIQRGDVTDDNFKEAFGLTSGKWNSLKAKMNARVNALNVLNSSAGE